MQESQILMSHKLCSKYEYNTASDFFFAFKNINSMTWKDSNFKAILTDIMVLKLKSIKKRVTLYIYHEK